VLLQTTFFFSFILLPSLVSQLIIYERFYVGVYHMSKCVACYHVHSAILCWLLLSAKLNYSSLYNVKLSYRVVMQNPVLADLWEVKAHDMNNMFFATSISVNFSSTLVFPHFSFISKLSMSSSRSSEIFKVGK
jgi:hypothetical protein